MIRKYLQYFKSWIKLSTVLVESPLMSHSCIKVFPFTELQITEFHKELDSASHN